MATVKRYEDLLAWQKSRTLVAEIYKEFKTCDDFGFKDQIQRAAVSIMSNIAEGFERGTKNEFINYLQIAKGSAGEVRAQLYIANDIGYLNSEKFKNLKNLAEEVSKLLFSLIKKVKKSEYNGYQYKKEKTEARLRAEKFDLQNLKKLAETKPEIFAKEYERKKEKFERENKGEDFEDIDFGIFK